MIIITIYSIVKSKMKNFDKAIEGIMHCLVQESVVDKEPIELPEHIKVFNISKPEKGFQEFDFDVKKQDDGKYTFITTKCETVIGNGMLKENKTYSNMESLEELLKEISIPNYTRRIYVEDGNGNLIYQSKF